MVLPDPVADKKKLRALALAAGVQQYKVFDLIRNARRDPSLTASQDAELEDWINQKMGITAYLLLNIGLEQVFHDGDYTFSHHPENADLLKRFQTNYNHEINKP